MQKLDRALRMGGGTEYGPLILPQHLQPALDIGRMVGTGLWRQGKIRAQERCPQFGDEFFARIAFITEFLDPELTIQAALMFRPVGQFMGKRRIIGLHAPEALETWHLNMITCTAVTGPTAAVANIGTGCCKELIRMRDAFNRIDHRLRLH